MRLFSVRRFSSSLVTLEPRVSVSSHRHVRVSFALSCSPASCLNPGLKYSPPTRGGNEPISSDRHDLQVPPLTALPGTTAAREASPLILLSFPFLSCHGGKAVAMVTGSLALIPHTALWLAYFFVPIKCNGGRTPQAPSAGRWRKKQDLHVICVRLYF